jgi:Gpi18-like mannosyltransferase
VRFTFEGDVTGVSQQPPSVSVQRPPLPRWIRAVDVICVVLIVLAATVAMSGGFRQQIGGIRLAMTSPVRLVLWAAALGIVRHLMWRDSPIYRDFPRRVAEWRRLPAIQSALSTVVLTRPAILLIGFLATVMIGPPGGTPPVRVSSNEVLNLQARWDAGWYMSIVDRGYSYDATQPEGQQNIAFFPAYPLIVRVFWRLFGGWVTSEMVAGTLVSCAAFFGALAYLYALARKTLDDDTARFAVWLVAAYPFAVYFGAIYTESLFLLAALGAFYHFRRRQFVIASLWGLLAGLSRPNGCLLSVALALLAVASWLPWSIAREPGGAPIPRSDAIKAIVAAAMPGIGMLIFSAFVWTLTGNALGWMRAHEAWGRTYQGIGKLAVERYSWITHEGLGGYVATLPHDVVNLVGVLFVLAAVWPVARRLGLAYAVFIVINVIPPLAAGGLISMGRLSSTMFPAFLWMAGAVPRAHRGGWIAAFAALQGLVAALFYTWRPLY